MTSKIFPLATILAVAVLAAPVAGQTMQDLADGQPWSVTMENNRRAEMTFYPDGQAEAKAPFGRVNMMWEATADGMCMEGGPRGRQCVTLRAIEGGGYAGLRDGEVILVFRR